MSFSSKHVVFYDNTDFTANAIIHMSKMWILSLYLAICQVFHVPAFFNIYGLSWRWTRKRDRTTGTGQKRQWWEDTDLCGGDTSNSPIVVTCFIFSLLNIILIVACYKRRKETGWTFVHILLQYGLNHFVYNFSTANNFACGIHFKNKFANVWLENIVK